MTKYLWTTLHVKDMETSLAFYRAHLGLEVNRRFKTPDGGEIAFLGTEGGTEVELIARPGETYPATEGITLGFEVANLDEKKAELEAAGIALHSGPFYPNPHIGFFFIQDPDGVKIQFVEQK